MALLNFFPLVGKLNVQLSQAMLLSSWLSTRCPQVRIARGTCSPLFVDVDPTCRGRTYSSCSSSWQLVVQDDLFTQPISSARPAGTNSLDNDVPDMSSWCCSFSQLFLACSNGNVGSEGTPPAGFKSSSLTVPSSNIPSSTASKFNLVCIGSPPISQMRPVI